MNELTEYLNGAVERLIGNALKASFKNPRESAFILKYAREQKKAAELRQSSEAGGTHIPPFLIASIASQCNLHCKGCYARANNGCADIGCGAANDLTAARWEEIFKEAVQLGIAFILLAGGEPLIRHDVIEAAARYRQIIFPVFTNGTMLDESYIKLFDKNRNIIPMLSIEGDEIQTDKRRGSGVYSTLKRAMVSMDGKGILYGASVTVTTENIDTVTDENFVSQLYQSGCKIIIYVEYVPVMQSTEYLALGDDDRERLATRQAVLKAQFEDMIFLSFPGDEQHVGGCLAAGRGFFHINAAGGAEPCPFSPYSDISLKSCSLKQALDSPLFYRLRAGGLLNEEHRGGCALFGRGNEVKALIKEA